MSNSIIPTSEITDEMLKNREDYNKSRFLFNKYSLEQLENWLKVDLYEALDLEFYRGLDIPEDILSYALKKKSTLYHPTKNQGKNQAFLVIKRAEQVLSNQKFRKVYDSAFLDESIPEDKEYSPEEFFDIFKPVFDRNGIFSLEQPVPSLTDSNFENFYKFWVNFKTNRAYDDPEDIFDQRGGSRRYLADKNKEILQKKKIADIQRIQKLVNIAYRRDPRTKKPETAAKVDWKEQELKMLEKLNVLLGKSKDKYESIAKKLNDLHLSKRTPNEVKAKIESLKKK